MKSFYFLLIVLSSALSACGPTNFGFDKLPYSDGQLQQIRRSYYYFYALDKRMAQDLHLVNWELGYAVDDSSLYFKKCLPAGKTLFVGADTCNYRSYLGAPSYEHLLRTIDSLRKLRIVGTDHSATGKLYFLIDNEYQQYGDGRLLALQDSVDYNLLSQWQLLDRKRGVLLFGDCPQQ